MNIVRVFFDVNMSKSFDGLALLMKGSKFNFDKAGDKSMVIFINKAQTRFKALFGQGNYMVYHSNGSRRIPLDAIQYFPQFFDGKEINLNAAIKKSIVKKLGIKGVDNNQ